MRVTACLALDKPNIACNVGAITLQIGDNSILMKTYFWEEA